MASTRRLCDRIAELDRAVIRSLSTEALEQMVADAPEWMCELSDRDLELIAEGRPHPPRLRALFAD